MENTLKLKNPSTKNQTEVLEMSSFRYEIHIQTVTISNKELISLIGNTN